MPTFLGRGREGLKNEGLGRRKEFASCLHEGFTSDLAQAKLCKRGLHE